MTPDDAFGSLNRITGLAPFKTPEFSGSDPVLPTPYGAASAAAAALGLAASAVHEIWRLRGGEAQTIAIDLKLAAASLVSFALQRLDGKEVPRPGATNPTIALYRAADRRWIHLHGGFRHLAKRTLELLNAENDAESIAAAVAKWNAFALEDALAHLGLCGAVARTAEEWRTSPQGVALENTPPISLTRIGDAPPLRLEKGEEPLEGVRVLDLTRVLAGPTAGRTLASHGADVLAVRARRLETIEAFDLDTGHGKRLADLDLAKPADAEKLRSLVRGAHVFVDSYRPGALAKLGFTPAALAHAAPGIVHVAVSAYGAHGPWGARRGW
ncbi:MAG TPA: CoA transferase, partial [Rhizomicrobium sp.]|nr:CoA transferase [Rhizomicrobium sp.]